MATLLDTLVEQGSVFRSVSFLADASSLGLSVYAALAELDRKGHLARRWENRGGTTTLVYRLKLSLLSTYKKDVIASP